MDLRTTISGRTASHRGRAAHSHRPRLAAARRPGLLLGVAAAGAVLVNVVVGVEPAAQAEAATGSVSVADELGLTAQSEALDAPADLAPLEDLVASRSSREAAETSAQKAQASADRAEVEKQKAEARAKARAAEKAAAKAAAKEAAAKEAAAREQEAEAAEQEAAAQAEAPAAQSAPTAQAAQPAASSSTAVAAIAQISNTSGPVAGRVQAAANAVVSNVSGAAGITLGGTRPSATDPGGHPSGLALDYMVMSNAGLGDAIAQYHIAHWDELGVEYIIWQQRYLSSPGGAWSSMSDRGSPTANHMDHVHVNYR